MNEESKNQSSNTDELIQELKEQAKQILKKVEKNDDGLCAFIIIATDNEAVVQIHSNPNERLYLAIKHTLMKNPQLIGGVKEAVTMAEINIAFKKAMREYIEGRYKTNEGNDGR